MGVARQLTVKELVEKKKINPLIKLEDLRLQPEKTGDEDDFYVVIGTKNYFRFHYNSLQRPLDQKLLKRLVKEIERKNLLRLFPIIVNSRGEIIDGQHRYEAAKLLHLRIYFIVDDTMLPEDAPRVSEAVGKWDIRALMGLWIKKENINYIILSDFFTQERGDISLYRCAMLCSKYPETKEDFKMAFAAGSYVIGSLDFANKVAKILRGYSQQIAFAYNRNFIAIVETLANNPDYDHLRMMHKLSLNPARLENQTSTKKYYEALNEVYNLYGKKGEFIDLNPKHGKK